MVVKVPWDICGAAAKTPSYEMVPTLANITIRASASPTSPTRLTTNAFFAAVAADGLYDQKPISRYDAKPTPSQPTYKPR